MSGVLSPKPAVEQPDVLSLLALAQRGDAESFCELCRTFESRLLRQATILCGDPALAEDLAQETLVEAWKCLRRYHHRCQFFTWLCAILLNRFRNFTRRNRPVALSTLDGIDQRQVGCILEALPDQGARPDEIAAFDERAASVREAIQCLSPKHREVIYLRFYVDDSLEGIAAAINCSVGTVKSRLFHALEKLRAMERIRRG